MSHKPTKYESHTMFNTEKITPPLDDEHISKKEHKIRDFIITASFIAIAKLIVSLITQ